METIQEAKQHLKENYKKGVKCPCCNQNVKLYKRRLGSVMARCLIKLSVMGEGYHHVKDIVSGISDTGTNDFSKLRYWGMIEEQSNDDDTKRTSGHWRITDKGRLFARNSIYVPMYVFIYNGKKQGFSVGETNIVEALGTKFNYSQLINDYASK
jgi:ssDNA-binding Zn-finger/Zn-ribbon topoisomerase 1